MGDNRQSLAEIKNQIIDNRTKKLSYLKLGAVASVANILTAASSNSICAEVAKGSSDSNNNILVQSAAVLGSFGCGFDDGMQAVLDAGTFPRLFRLLSYPDEKISMFSPIGAVISVILSVITVGDKINLGSLVGMFLMFTSLYFVLWAKGKENFGSGVSLESDLDDEEKPLLLT